LLKYKEGFIKKKGKEEKKIRREMKKEGIIKTINTMKDIKY
jgi:hypothetical protein